MSVEGMRRQAKLYDNQERFIRTLKLKERELDAVTRDISEKLVARATVDSELVPS